MRAELDRFNDLMQQGFMRSAYATPKAPKQPAPIVACADCMDWHRKGQHTADAETRKARRRTRAREAAERRGAL